MARLDRSANADQQPSELELGSAHASHPDHPGQSEVQRSLPRRLGLGRTEWPAKSAAISVLTGYDLARPLNALAEAVRMVDVHAARDQFSGHTDGSVPIPLAQPKNGMLGQQAVVQADQFVDHLDEVP